MFAPSGPTLRGRSLESLVRRCCSRVSSIASRVEQWTWRENCKEWSWESPQTTEVWCLYNLIGERTEPYGEAERWTVLGPAFSASILVRYKLVELCVKRYIGVLGVRVSGLTLNIIAYPHFVLPYQSVVYIKICVKKKESCDLERWGKSIILRPYTSSALNIPLPFIVLEC